MAEQILTEKVTPKATEGRKKEKTVTMNEFLTALKTEAEYKISAVLAFALLRCSQTNH